MSLASTFVTVVRRCRGAGSWSPGNLSGLIQRFLDEETAYYGSTLSSYPILTPEEPGTVAVPRAGRAWLFDGSNDYATLGARLTSGSVTALTVCAWVKFSASTQYKVVTSEWTFGTGNAAWSLSVAPTGSGGGVSFALSGDGTTVYSALTSASVQDGTWHHVSAVYTGAAVTIYVDGVNAMSGATISGSVPASLKNGTAAFMIGAQDAGTFGFANGSIYGLRVYNVAKSPTEVLAITNQHLTPTTLDRTGLLGAWWCEEESGTTGYDWSGNGKNLTLTNITQATFHAADTAVKYSAANSLGHTLANNLLTYSEQFDNAAWSGLTSAVTANAATAPDGTLTADQIDEFTNLGRRQMTVAVSIGQTYTFSCWVKAASSGSSTHVRLSTNNQSAWNTGGSTKVALTNDWQRASVTWTQVGTTAARLLITSLDNSGATDTDVSGAVLVWGAQLEASASVGGYIQATSSVVSNVVIPRNEADTTKDAAGNALGVTGPVAYPATVEVNCVTGDGTGVYCDLGSALIPASADFSIQLLFKSPSTSLSYLALFSQGANTTGRFYLYERDSLLRVQTPSLGEIFCSYTVGVWNRVVIERIGGVFTITTTNLSTGVVTTGSGADATAISVSKNTVLHKRGSNYWSGSLSDLRITTGGVTKYFPLQGGPGTSNTNRDLHWVGSDGTGGVVSGAIVNGTVANIWANRCPYVRDWCIENGGGIAANGAFVPGRIGSANDAAGNAKTLSAGKFGNPYSRLNRNRWAAPALVNIGVTASDSVAPSTNVQGNATVDTQFRRSKADGSDRYFAASAALTGSDKTNAEAYTA